MYHVFYIVQRAISPPSSKVNTGLLTSGATFANHAILLSVSQNVRLNWGDGGGGGLDLHKHIWPF